MSAAPVRPASYWRISQLESSIGPDLNKRLEVLYGFILQHNKGGVLLIPKKGEIDADVIHFLDVYYGSRIILEATSAKTIVDIGSLNGLPGIMLAFLAPDRKITICEPEGLRADLLQELVNNAGLENLTFFKGTVEKFAPGGIDCGVVRSPVKLSKVVLQFRSQFRVGGELFHFQGQNWLSEIADIPTQVCSIWTPKLVKDYSLPVVNQKMGVVVTKKIAP